MGYSTLIYILVLFFSTFSCGSSGEKGVQKDSSDSVKQSLTKQDSMPEITPPPPGLPPNTMRVKGKLLKINATKSDEIASIELRVLQILGVGSATPPVAAQDTLLIRVSALSDTLNKGKEFVGIISHHQIIAQQQNKQTPWQLERVENERDHN